MIEHSPFVLPSLFALVMISLLWGFFELVMWAGILVGSECRWPFVVGAFARFDRATRAIARHRLLAVAIIFLSVFLGRIAILSVSPIPPPKFADEFSQMLAADTFAAGRVTNPTHPMWFYFETIFVNQKPTYHSMYPPATGLFMAAAQVLTGQPWYGMLFSVAAGCAAVCWMLQGWVPQRWALWGSIVFVLLSARIHLTENYLGEGVIVLGGALVLGAIPRIIKRKTTMASIWLGIGVVLLATTRPYEGIFLVAGLGLGAYFWSRMRGARATTFLKKFALPVTAILLPALVMVGYLNWRSTGSPVMAPYQLNLAQQHITKPMVWQKLTNSPTYDHLAMAKHYEQWELNWLRNTHNFPRGAALLLADKVGVAYETILWPLAVVLVVGSIQLLKSRTMRFLPLSLVLVLLGLGFEAYPLMPRYLEPAWGLVVLLAVYGLRYIGVWRRKSRQGLRITRAACVLIPTTIFIVYSTFFVIAFRSHFELWYAARADLAKILESMPGKQLVVVRYSPSHVPSEEWVYNRADIDSAKVVWARDADNGNDADLLRYFAGRTVWLLEPDENNPKLSSYSPNCTSRSPEIVGPFRVSCCDPQCDGMKSGHDRGIAGVPGSLESPFR